MRLLLAVAALAGCSSKKAAPPPAQGSAAAPVAAGSAAKMPELSMHSTAPVDLTKDITHVQLVPMIAVGADGKPTSEKGVFTMHWHASTRAADIRCRIEAYNLVYFDSTPEAVNAKPDEHEMLYRPDPFVVQPTTCEARFYDDKRTIVARACYAKGALTWGPCDGGAFPAPKMPEHFAIDVQGASVHLTTSGDVQLKALFTVAAPLPDKNTTLSLTCDGIASKPAPGEGLVPLSKLAAGETLYTWELAFFMSKPLTAPPKQCELTVTNKTKLGTFCLHEGSTDSGPCGS